MRVISHTCFCLVAGLEIAVFGITSIYLWLKSWSRIEQQEKEIHTTAVLKSTASLSLVWKAVQTEKRRSCAQSRLMIPHVGGTMTSSGPAMNPASISSGSNGSNSHSHAGGGSLLLPTICADLRSEFRSLLCTLANDSSPMSPIYILESCFALIRFDAMLHREERNIFMRTAQQMIARQAEQLGMVRRTRQQLTENCVFVAQLIERCTALEFLSSTQSCSGDEAADAYPPSSLNIFEDTKSPSSTTTAAVGGEPQSTQETPLLPQQLQHTRSLPLKRHSVGRFSFDESLDRLSESAVQLHSSHRWRQICPSPPPFQSTERASTANSSSFEVSSVERAALDGTYVAPAVYAGVQQALQKHFKRNVKRALGRRALTAPGALSEAVSGTERSAQVIASATAARERSSSSSEKEAPQLPQPRPPMGRGVYTASFESNSPGSPVNVPLGPLSLLHSPTNESSVMAKMWDRIFWGFLQGRAPTADLTALLMLLQGSENPSHSTLAVGSPTSVSGSVVGGGGGSEHLQREGGYSFFSGGNDHTVVGSSFAQQGAGSVKDGSVLPLIDALMNRKSFSDRYPAFGGTPESVSGSFAKRGLGNLSAPNNEGDVGDGSGVSVSASFATDLRFAPRYREVPRALEQSEEDVQAHLYFWVHVQTILTTLVEGMLYSSNDEEANGTGEEDGEGRPNISHGSTKETVPGEAEVEPPEKVPLKLASLHLPSEEALRMLPHFSPLLRNYAAPLRQLKKKAPIYAMTAAAAAAASVPSLAIPMSVPVGATDQVPGSGNSAAVGNADMGTGNNDSIVPSLVHLATKLSSIADMSNLDETRSAVADRTGGLPIADETDMGILCEGNDASVRPVDVIVYALMTGLFIQCAVAVNQPKVCTDEGFEHWHSANDGVQWTNHADGSSRWAGVTTSFATDNSNPAPSPAAANAGTMPGEDDDVGFSVSFPSGVYDTRQPPGHLNIPTSFRGSAPAVSLSGFMSPTSSALMLLSAAHRLNDGVRFGVEQPTEAALHELGEGKAEGGVGDGDEPPLAALERDSHHKECISLAMSDVLKSGNEFSYVSLPSIMRAELQHLLEQLSASVASMSRMEEQVRGEMALLIFRILSTVLDWLMPSVSVASPRIWLMYRKWCCDLYRVLCADEILLQQFMSLLNQNGVAISAAAASGQAETVSTEKKAADGAEHTDPSQMEQQTEKAGTQAASLLAKQRGGTAGDVTGATSPHPSTSTSKKAVGRKGEAKAGKTGIKPKTKANSAATGGGGPAAPSSSRVDPSLDSTTPNSGAPQPDAANESTPPVAKLPSCTAVPEFDRVIPGSNVKVSLNRSSSPVRPGGELQLGLSPDISSDTAASRAAAALLNEETVVPLPHRYLVTRLTAATIRGIDEEVAESLLYTLFEVPTADSAKTAEGVPHPMSEGPFPAGASASIHEAKEEQEKSDAVNGEGPSLAHHHRFRYPSLSNSKDVARLYENVLEDADTLLSPHDPLYAALVLSTVDLYVRELKDTAAAVALLNSYLADVEEERIQVPVRKPLNANATSSASFYHSSSMKLNSPTAQTPALPGGGAPTASTFSVTRVRSSASPQSAAASGGAGSAATAASSPQQSQPMVPTVIPSWNSEEDKDDFIATLSVLREMQCALVVAAADQNQGKA